MSAGIWRCGSLSIPVRVRGRESVSQEHMTRKIFLFSFSLGALVLMISSLIFFGLQYRQTMDETYESLRGRASYAMRGLEAGGTAYLESLDPFNRITWIARDGRVLYDSAYPDLQELQDRDPEVKQALETGEGRGIRKSSPDGQQTMYYAVLCSDGTVLRVSRPVSAVRYAFAAVSPVLWAILLVLLISAVMAFRIANSIARPINEMDLDDLPNAAAYPELEPLVGRLTEQRRTIERQVQEREEHARERERMRREFTANVSHELKTPLTSISGFAELMSSGLCDDAKMIEFSGDIYRESRRLITLVNDILHLSELDELAGTDGAAGAYALTGIRSPAGAEQAEYTQEEYSRRTEEAVKPASGEKEEKREKQEISNIPGREMRRVDLFQIACDTVKRLQPAARKNHVTISVAGKPSYVFGVIRVLEEIVYNLCDNAIKYNHDNGSVDVYVRTDRAGRALLFVADTGIGIPPEEQERVFERFYRVDKSHSRRIGGTGLGLSIVKHGAQLHGASVEMESAPGKGTRITLRFPPPREEM